MDSNPDFMIAFMKLIDVHARTLKDGIDCALAQNLGKPDELAIRYQTAYNSLCLLRGKVNLCALEGALNWDGPQCERIFFKPD